MSAGHQPTSHPPSQTWTEPPWSGWIETTGDALLILEAARRGLIPRVTRRLVDSERKMITSGSVFVFDEDESGIKRWTDGFFWSPSRILGNFLLYRETDKRGNRSARAPDPDSDSADPMRGEGALSRPKNESTSLGIDKHRERSLCGSLTNSYKFKSDGLMKKTFSLTIGGVAQHLISYYKIEDVENGRLRTPSSLPELASLEISPEYLDKTHFRNAPKVEIGADGIPRYRGEGEEVDSSSPTSASSSGHGHALPPPIETTLPLLTDGHIAEGSSSAANNKRNAAKRYLPYGAPATRPSKKSKSQGTEPSSMSLSPSLPGQDPAGGAVVLTPPPQSAPPRHHPPPAAPSYAADTNVPPGAYQYPPYFPPPPPPPSMGYQPPPTAMYPPPPQASYPPPPPPHGTTPPQMTAHVPQYPVPAAYPGYSPPVPSASPDANSDSGNGNGNQPQQQQQPPPPPPPPHHHQPHPQSYGYPPYYPPPPAPPHMAGHHHAHPPPPSHIQPHGYPTYQAPPPPPSMTWGYAGYPHPQAMHPQQQQHPQGQGQGQGHSPHMRHTGSSPSDVTGSDREN